MTPTKRKDVRAAIVGMVLGDAHLLRHRLRNGQPTGNYGLDIAHSARQRAYLEWKASLLQPLFHYNLEVRDKRSARYPTVRLQTRTSPRITFVANRVLVGGERRITPWALENMGDLGMAILFMDDGHLRLRKSHGNEVSIGVYGFPRGDVELLRDWIEARYGADFKVSQNVKYKGQDRGWYLRRGLSHGRLMLDRLAPFAPEAMQHKFNYGFQRGPYNLE